MVARIKKSSEEAKVAPRNIRRDANKHFDTGEKNKEMTETMRQGKEDVQKLLTLRGQVGMLPTRNEGSHGAVGRGSINRERGRPSSNKAVSMRSSVAPSSMATGYVAIPIDRCCSV